MFSTPNDADINVHGQESLYLAEDASVVQFTTRLGLYVILEDGGTHYLQLRHRGSMELIRQVALTSAAGGLAVGPRDVVITHPSEQRVDFRDGITLELKRSWTPPQPKYAVVLDGVRMYLLGEDKKLYTRLRLPPYSQVGPVPYEVAFVATASEARVTLTADSLFGVQQTGHMLFSQIWRYSRVSGESTGNTATGASCENVCADGGVVGELVLTYGFAYVGYSDGAVGCVYDNTLDSHSGRGSLLDGAVSSHGLACDDSYLYLGRHTPDSLLRVSKDLSNEDDDAEIAVEGPVSHIATLPPHWDLLPNEARYIEGKISLGVSRDVPVRMQRREDFFRGIIGIGVRIAGWLDSSGFLGKHVLKVGVSISGWVAKSVPFNAILGVGVAITGWLRKQYGIQKVLKVGVAITGWLRKQYGIQKVLKVGVAISGWVLRRAIIWGVIQIGVKMEGDTEDDEDGYRYCRIEDDLTGECPEECEIVDEDGRR